MAITISPLEFHYYFSWPHHDFEHILIRYHQSSIGLCRMTNNCWTLAATLASSLPHSRLTTLLALRCREEMPWADDFAFRQLERKYITLRRWPLIISMGWLTALEH
jgi:hypothetical protein